ncbi:MAG TPA: hypothetical protein VN260_07515 [Dissulfurispiraceae bacterium]|nr:hypothetical protein [Dissulfurispiraceae bacterium]
MKEGQWTDMICRGYCPYYKEGKEDLHCAPYMLLVKHFTVSEIRTALGVPRGECEPDFTCDEEIEEIACRGCEFLVGGCDFRQDRSGPPCGGYTVLEAILKHFR